MSKRLSILILTFAILLPSLASALNFTDVGEDNIYFLPIHQLRSLGIVQGYPDNTFEPQNPLTKAVAAWIVFTAYHNDPQYQLDIPDLDPSATFPDMIATDWYAKYLVKAEQLGIWSPDADGNYHPDSPVTRAEFFKLVLTPSGLDLDQFDDSQIYTDVPNYAWFAKYMNFAGMNGLIIADRENKLYPSEILNRGQAAEMGYTLYLLLKADDYDLLDSQLKANLDRSLYYLDHSMSIASKRSAAFAVGLGQKLINDLPDNSDYLAEAKLAKVLNYTINYQLLKSIEGQAEQANYWLDKAQSKFAEIVDLPPELSAYSDDIQTYWPSVTP